MIPVLLLLIWTAAVVLVVETAGRTWQAWRWRK